MTAKIGSSTTAGAVGVVSGFASALFLCALDVATNLREAHPNALWFLPLAGYLIGEVYHRFGRGVGAGNDLILDEIHEPKATIPARMIPLVLGGTVLTHLCGGSAGREGTAVQMGGALAERIARMIGSSAQKRRVLLMAGMSGGFGSVFGVPFAGAIFGIEVLGMGRRRRGRGAFVECLLASYVGHRVVLALGVHHATYPAFAGPGFAGLNLFWLMTTGALCGACAWLFAACTHFTAGVFRRVVRYAPLRPAVGGALVALGFSLIKSTRYAGLGVPVIQEAFAVAVGPWDFALKIVFTALTLGSGLKGGEVTPLLFIGATFGNALAAVVPLPLETLAAVGLVAVFAGAANTPVACTVMAMELFGPAVGPYALVACVMSYLCSGSRGIYRAQRLRPAKWRLWEAKPTRG